MWTSSKLQAKNSFIIFCRRWVNLTQNTSPGTLTNYIKRLLSNKQVPLGEGGVTVKHFFELCSEIIGQDLAYEKEEQDYYDIIVQEALEKVEDFGKKYDAILVDEGQDLSDDMYRVLVALLSKKTNNLTISLDENQNIYKRRTSWKDLGIQDPDSF